MLALDFREKDIGKVVAVVRQLMEGRSVAAGQIELRANEATTVVENDVIPAGCFPQLTPASASAAAEWGNGTIYVASVDRGSFTIAHANSATAGRLVNWYAVGG